MRRSLAVLLTVPLLAAAACSTSASQNVITATPGSKIAMSGWRRVATLDDRERLRVWRTSFVNALAAARKAGHGAQIDAEGPLLQPDAAIGGGLPDGLYRCRVIKVGAKRAGFQDFIVFPGFSCKVGSEGDLHSLAKLDGAQRPVGLIFPDSETRSVFLGTMVFGDELRAMHYGRDPDRDTAGWIERIGDKRWRMIVPDPRFESQLDIYDLVPQGE